jgi:outer membrane protein TolC
MNLKKPFLSMQKHFVFYTALLLLYANLPAQETTIRISPDEAVKMALENNLSLESNRVNLTTKERAARQSWNQFIPNVTVAGSVMRDNEASTVSGFVPVDLATALNPVFDALALPLPPGTINLPSNTIYGVVPYSVEISPWKAAGTIQATMNINIAMFENMKRLSLDYKTGIIGYEKAKLQLERDVRKAYHNMLLLQENIQLLQGSFENLQRQVQIAQANYNAGLAPQLILLQAQVARENMRPIIDQANDFLKLSMAQFAMYLGLDYDTQFDLIPVPENANFIQLDIAELISLASRGKPEIMELRHTILMLQSARRAQAFSLTPTLSLSYNYNTFLIDPWDNTWFGSDSNWINSGTLTISLGLRLHSLIPFSTDFQGIRNMDDQINAANVGLAQLINGTEIEIYNIILTLEKIQITTEAQKETIGLAEQSYRLTEQAYRAGLQDYFQVQSAEQSLRQAQVQLLEQQFNYLNSLIDLEYAIGVPFGTLSSIVQSQSSR